MTPIVTQVVGDELYVRVHRRVGEDRLLSDRELADWARRIENIPVKPTRVWMMWNTNFEMQAIENGQKLEALLPPHLVVNWKQLYLEAQKANPNSLFSFFKPGVKPAAGGAAAAAAAAADDDDEDFGGEGDQGGSSPKKREAEADLDEEAAVATAEPAQPKKAAPAPAKKKAAAAPKKKAPKKAAPAGGAAAPSPKKKSKTGDLPALFSKIDKFFDKVSEVEKE